MDTERKHATCETCGKEMKPGTPCTYTHWVIDGIPVARDTQGFGTEICHDCNAPLGKPHHLGCDAERCPLCGGQALSCDCLELVDQVCYMRS